MTEYCSFCGRINPPYEKHHVAGFINHPFWTARACTDCHLILSGWQWARRTPRDKEHEPPDSVKLQAIYEGLTSAFQVASECAGQSPASIAAGSIIARLLRHDPDPMAGRDFSPDGNYPKFKAKSPIRVPKRTMCGENFQRVLAAMCDMMAFISESSEPMSQLAALLRQISEQIPFRWPSNVPGADFLVALGTADETVIREQLSKFAAEIGIRL